MSFEIRLAARQRVGKCSGPAEARNHGPDFRNPPSCVSRGPPGRGGGTLSSLNFRSSWPAPSYRIAVDSTSHSRSDVRCGLSPSGRTRDGRFETSSIRAVNSHVYAL
jgi:hypothetical protein